MGKEVISCRLLLAALLASAVLHVGLALSAHEEEHTVDRDQNDPSEYLPIVMWHGMGDSCCSEASIGSVKKLLEDKLGVFVLSIATGSTEALDVWSSYFGNVNKQVDDACNQIRSTPELQNGFNAIGFSQGGQFMRAVVERCQHLGPKAHTLITVGSQHQGVMTAPGCEASLSEEAPVAPVEELELFAQLVEGRGDLRSKPAALASACREMQVLLSKGAFLDFIQERVIQAQYFKNPHTLDEYYRHSIFLPDINNEQAHKSEQYKTNLLSLDRFVMFRFDDDTTVVPRDSSWFSFFDGSKVVPLQEQPLYTEDWLGLRQMDEDGKLVFESAPGKHMHFSFDWFEQVVIDKYLK